MPKYARDTSVSVEKSRAEIERTLSRFGATHFMYGWAGEGKAAIEFIAVGRRVRFRMQLPDRNSKRFKFREVYKRERENTPEQAEKLWEQECRQHWRALALLVKAKLAGVEAGISSFEEEFLAHIVVPTGDGSSSTAGEVLIPQLEAVYKSGKLPLLLLPGATEE